MLDDAELAVVLTNGRLAAQLPACETLICVDEFLLDVRLPTHGELMATTPRPILLLTLRPTSWRMAIYLGVDRKP